jgi:hypothetical protein
MGELAPIRIVRKSEFGEKDSRPTPYRPTGINIMCTYDVDVVKVKVLDDYRLYLQFADGKAGELDIAKLVPFVGVFASLKDKKFFNAVTVNSDIGTICWANGADLAPSYLYENLGNESH